MDEPGTSGQTLERDAIYNNLKQSRAEFETGADGQWTSHGQYMRAKVAKLRQQVNDGVEVKSDMFKGLSIYVNGYTDPPALELRRLFVENGGQYHHYYAYGTTTYTIASAMALSKFRTLRPNEIVIRPSWVTDCVTREELLPIEGYLLTVDEPQVHTSTASSSKGAVQEFYQRSRLHLISTLAQDMKTHVANMRSDKSHEFESRHKLDKFRDSLGENEDVEPVICHIDMDCFFVSVALRTRPELKGKPIAITHSKGTSGKGFAEIASCSYEARAFNIRAGMWINEAVTLCKDLVCLPYEFDDYKNTSIHMYDIISRYTLDIKAVSCDELYVDLTPLLTELNIGNPMDVIGQIRKDIEQETKCTASAGLGPNMLIARLATKKAKPNGQNRIKTAEVRQFMRTTKIADIPGLGYSTISRLRSELGDLKTCKELREVGARKLQEMFGQKQGRKIFDACRGLADPFQPTDHSSRKSVSCDMNFGIRLSAAPELHKIITDLAHQLSAKMRDGRIKGRTVGLRLLIRAPEAPLIPEKYGAHGLCESEYRSHVLPESTNDPAVIANTVITLSKVIKPKIEDVRGIGIQVTRLDGRPNQRTRATSPTLSPSQRSIQSFVTKKSRTDTPDLIDLTSEDEPGKKPPPQLIRKQPKRKRRKEVQFRRRVRYGKLPKASQFCVCGSHAEPIQLDLNRAPPPLQVLKLRCKFANLVKSRAFVQAHRDFADLHAALYASDAARLDWLELLARLALELNRLALHQSFLRLVSDDHIRTLYMV